MDVFMGEFIVGDSVDCAGKGARGSVPVRCCSFRPMFEFASMSAYRSTLAPASALSAASAPVFASVFASALLFILCISFLLAVVPGQAFARSYDMPKVDIAAEAKMDGSLHVVELRTFELHGDRAAMQWVFDDLPDEAKLQVNGVQLITTRAENEASESLALPSVPFRISWRNGGGPEKSAYSVDVEQDTLYVFPGTSDEILVVALDYTIKNGIQAYRDVAEIYWKYVGGRWDEASADVSMTLTLPVPKGTFVTLGENVHAWGHGPLDGVVSMDESGSITYSIPKVNAGQYAEARVVFPASWLSLSNMGSAVQAHRNETRLETVLSEEQLWFDQANHQRMLHLSLVIAFGVVCVLLLLWALWMYFKHGKERMPSFKGKYWSTVPDPFVPPAVIGRLWRWNRESRDDFVATLIHLVYLGVVRVNEEWQAGCSAPRRPKRVMRARNERSSRLGVVGSVDDGACDVGGVCDYRLTLRSTAKLAADAGFDSCVVPGSLNLLDRAAINVLFRDVAGGRDSLLLSDIRGYGKTHPQEFLSAMDHWQDLLSRETAEQNFFEAKGTRLQKGMLAVAALVLILGVIVFAFMKNPAFLFFAVPTAIALGVIANYLPRRTVRGNDLAAKCKALRNWLRDSSPLDDGSFGAAGVQGDLAAYAYLFGVFDSSGRAAFTMPHALRLALDEALSAARSAPAKTDDDDSSSGGEAAKG